MASCGQALRHAGLALVAAFAISPESRALPVDGSVDLVVGQSRFLKISDVKAVESDNPKLFDVEIMPSGEILVLSNGPGRGLMFLVSSSRTAAWRLRSRELGGKLDEVTPSEDNRHSATRACPGLKDEAGSEAREVSATIPNAACRRALKKLLDADAYRARSLELVFSLEAIQDQLADIDERLKANGLSQLTAQYEGATLVVQGTLPHDGWGRLAKAFYEGAVGRVAPDFRFEEAPAPPKANAAGAHP